MAGGIGNLSVAANAAGASVNIGGDHTQVTNNRDPGPHEDQHMTEANGANNTGSADQKAKAAAGNSEVALRTDVKYTGAASQVVSDTDMNSPKAGNLKGGDKDAAGSVVKSAAAAIDAAATNTTLSNPNLQSQVVNARRDQPAGRG